MPSAITGPSTDYDGAYSVSWGSVATATSYELQRKLGSGSWSLVQSTSATTRNEPSMAAGTYSYRVRACNSSGCSNYTATKTVVVTLPPAVPGAISGPGSDYDGAYTVSWSVVSAATSYTLQRQFNGGSWSTVQSTSATSRNESGMGAGTYGYRVNACNAAGCSGYSTTKTVSVVFVPGTPGAISGPSSDADGAFTLSWGSVSTATSYTLQQQINDGAWSTVQSSSATSFAASVSVNGDYDYRVNACNAAGCSSYTSPDKRVVVTLPPPSASGQEDPYPAPGAFSPPSAANFPDATIVNPSLPLGDSSVGALSGSGGVSGGQASYSIPIVVPPGRKGMQPSVSLGYSSSGGNGTVGVGWGLSAGSSISRCSATVAQDGFTASVQYDATRDRLCLDGMRLMVVSGTYGTSNAEYRTELDSFVRVKQLGGGINGTGTYFTVEYKGGHKSWFGNSSATRFVATGRTETMTWALRDQRDVSGNTVIYDYQNFGDGENHISAIHYTGFNGSTGDRHVRFVYEANGDARTYYMAGGKMRLTQRLKEIKTEYVSTLVRKYSLTYSASLSTGRNLLKSAQECAYENGATAHCFPVTDFEWLEKAPAFVTERLSFFQGSTSTPVYGTKEQLHELVPRGDANGDGVKDWPEHQVNAEGAILYSGTIDLANCYKAANSLQLTCLDADLDADGLSDGVRRNNNVLEIKFADSTSWISTGITWTSGISVTISDWPLGFADFNGDGWVDLAMKQASSLYVYFNTKNLAAPFSSSNKQLIYTLGSQGTNHTTDIQIYGDMDGNGTPDFVVSDIPGTNDVPGLPTPDYIILTQSNAGGGMTTSTRNVPSYVSSATTGIAANANFFHDINGDGLQDLVSMKENTLKLQFKENTGTGFAATWVNLNFSIPTREVQFEVIPGEPAVAAYPIMSKLLVMDYDGNGKSEMLVASAVLASSCTYLNQAAPYTAGWYCDEELYETYQAESYAAVGAPINGATLDNSVRNYKAYQFNEGTSGAITVSSFITGIVASASQTAIVDATGDGLPDVVTAFGCRYDPACEFNNTTVSGLGKVTNSAYSTTGAWINRNLGTATDDPNNSEFEYAAYDMMSAAEDAFGNRHEWLYKPLSSDAYDTANSNYYETTHSYQASDADYFHFASSMYVVAEHKGSDGLGGLNSTLYRYRGAIFNNKGRGFQGFRSIIVEEDIFASSHSLANTDKISRTDFIQKWPESSQIEQACTFLVVDNVADDNPNCTSVISLSTVNSIHNVATSGGARFVAASGETAKSYDLTTRALLTTSVTTRTFDTAGNVTYESQSHVDDWTSNLSETTNVYSLDWSNWWLNKVTSSKAKSNPVSARHASSPYVNAANQDTVKEVTTTFPAYDATHRLPTTVTVSGNDTTLTSTVTTAFNTYGLPTSISTSGTNVTGPRTVTTSYSKDGSTASVDGYFPYKISNVLSHEVETHTDPALGVATDLWDANDLHTISMHDAFGRATDVTGPGMPTASTRLEWCGGAVWCISGAKYRVQTISAASPRNYTYLDAFGRTIYAISRNFNNTNWTRVRNTFDVRGNPVLQSLPYDATVGDPSNPGVHYDSYDALGRITQKRTDQANGTSLTTTYSYTGFTTNINAGGILMHRIHNGLGQLVETKDGAGGYTRYAFDGAGNPIVLQDPKMVAMGSAVGIKAAFNSLGHKQWVEDPDWWNTPTSTYGQKVFTYNALGEVLSESDPNGNLLAMSYDVLGRLSERTVNGWLRGKWHYDNTGTYKGLGLLDFEDSQFGPDGTRLQKFYYYGNASGRKDLLQVTHRI